jgi:hypothetical protein
MAVEREALRDWHRLFGLLLTDFFSDSPFTVEVERDLSQQQFLDVVIVRRRRGKFAGALPDGLGDLGEHNLITFKSLGEALDDWAIRELLGSYVAYRKLVSPSPSDLLPAARFRLYAVCARFPQRGFQVSPHLGEVEEQPQQFIQGALLNLCSRLPARHGCWSHFQTLSQGGLRQPEFLATPADLLRFEQVGRAPERLGDAAVGVRVKEDRSALRVLAAKNSQSRNGHLVRPAIVDDFGGVIHLLRHHRALAALGALPGKGTDFRGFNVFAHERSQSPRRGRPGQDSLPAPIRRTTRVPTPAHPRIREGGGHETKCHAGSEFPAPASLALP